MCGLPERELAIYQVPFDRQRWESADGTIIERLVTGDQAFFDDEVAAAFATSALAEELGAGDVVESEYVNATSILDQRAWPTDANELLAAMRATVSSEGNPISETAALVELAGALLRERRILGMMEHPAVVPIYETGQWPDGTPFFAMRRIDGPTLAEVISDAREFAQRIVGMENLLVMMITNEKAACALFDRLLQLKLGYWQKALAELGDLVDIVTYADDYGTQESQIISPDMFRRLIKPRVKILFETFIKSAPQAKRFFHSDGNVRPLIPDFIEMGVDILNPIQTSTGSISDLPALKKRFGKNIVFCGAIDTHRILPFGSVAEVREEVKRVMQILGPGGGYLVGAVHTVMNDVPPENVLAMVDAVKEFGEYG